MRKLALIRGRKKMGTDTSLKMWMMVGKMGFNFVFV